MLEVIENGRDITFSESVTVITSTLLATHFHDINKIGRIQSIHIPESITSIQAYALNHIGIQHIILPKTLQVIEPYVFNYDMFKSNAHYASFQPGHLQIVLP